MGELMMVKYYMEFGLKMGELLEVSKGAPWGEVGEDKVEMVEVRDEKVEIGEVVEVGEEKVEIIGQMVEVGEEKVESTRQMVEVREEKVETGLEIMKGWRRQGPRKGKSSSRRRVHFWKFSLSCRTGSDPSEFRTWPKVSWRRWWRR